MRLAVIIVAITACLAGLIAYTAMWDAKETEIWTGLEAMSQPLPDTRPFRNYEFICVAFSSGELLAETNRIGRDVYSTCLGTDSNYMLFVSVKNGQTSCKQTTRFLFIPAEGSPTCIRPENMIVRKKAYAGEQWARNWGITQHGATYFEIGQKQP